MKKEIAGGRIFVCTNAKPPDKPQCLTGEGEKCAEWLKSEIEKRNLKSRVRVVKTRCQHYCYPEGISILFEPTHEQYSAVRFDELSQLFDDFLARLE